MGTPMDLAMWPAHTSPKLPVGTEKLTFSSLASVMRIHDDT